MKHGSIRAWVIRGIFILNSLLSSAKWTSASREEEKLQQTKNLAQAYLKCTEKLKRDPVRLQGLYCNRTWDNVMCWPDTEPGVLMSLPCPNYIFHFDPKENATKYCQENGTWYSKPSSVHAWTNFSACLHNYKPVKENIPEIIVEHMPGIKLMYTVGYSLSLSTLILAVAIMIYFRKLHCPRNLIHLNMFVAFLVRAAFSLMRNVLLVNDLGFPIDVNNTGAQIEFIKEGTHWECKLFFTLFYYIIFVTMMWIFNEGLYLVLILSVAVFARKTKIRWFVVIGWGFPMIFIIPWVICRIHLDDMLCWNVHRYNSLYWILHAPMVASVAVNFIFFINILRILFTKLTASNCPESKKVRYRKLAKSTLILIPLFAVYYMGFIWIPDKLSPTSDLIKVYIEMIFNSFQGFLVALLFCFLNAEVQNEICKKWQRDILQRTGSWPSFSSIFHHGRDNRRYDNTRLNSRQDSHTVMENVGSHSDIPQPALPLAKMNGYLTPICEEISLLNDTNTRTKVQVCSNGQDHNENHTVAYDANNVVNENVQLNSESIQ